MLPAISFVFSILHSHCTSRSLQPFPTLLLLAKTNPPTLVLNRVHTVPLGPPCRPKNLTGKWGGKLQSISGSGGLKQCQDGNKPSDGKTWQSPLVADKATYQKINDDKGVRSTRWCQKQGDIPGPKKWLLRRREHYGNVKYLLRCFI